MKHRRGPEAGRGRRGREGKGREGREAIRLEKAISPFLLEVVRVGRNFAWIMGRKRDTRSAFVLSPSFRNQNGEFVL